MLESLYAEAFFDSILKNDSTLIGNTALGSASNIFRNRAKQGAVCPYLIYNLQSATDFLSANKTRLFSEYRFQSRIVGQVKGIDLQDAARVRASAGRMDTVLNVRRGTITISGVSYSFNIWRENELTNREEDGETPDVFYRNFGGIYVAQVF